MIADPATPRRTRVLIEDTLPDFVRAEFDGAFATRYCRDLNVRDVRLVTEEIDAVVVTVKTRVDRTFLARLAPSVRMVATYSVGTDHIDLEAAAEHGVAIANTPNVLTDAVAEIALFLTLGAMRRATESLDLIRSGAWTGWTPTQLIGAQLTGRTMGILGMGRIGRGIAARAAAFGMSIAYFNRSRLSPELEAGASFCPALEDLLPRSDVLMLAAPSTAETRGLLNRQRLALLPRNAVVINIARGDLVDDDALIEALQAKTVAAAGLDVFAGEPDFDKRYLELPNAFILPHIGSSTREARLGMGRILISQIRTVCGAGD